MEYFEIIRQKAYRPIKCAEISSQPHFTFCVKFQDGIKICQKCEVGLREFMCIIQHLEYEKISGNTDHCISSPIGYWALLGFRANDAILFRDDKDCFLPILFSSS